MADHAFAGISGNTSLRSLRERLAAMAQELAEERRRKRGINSSAVTTKRSSCTPVLDGSVLKNDIKQQLAKERREERKRQQEANKEKQLLEKEQKAKVQYEKQLEERHRKLREQKEKDERRRVSAEEKRKQKQAEDKEKFKAVVSRTMERCNRVDQRQKRWSWEGGATNIEKSGKTENKRSSSLNRKDNQLHPNVAMEHMDNTPGMTKYVFRYVTVPMFTSDELKSSTMFCKSSVKMPVPAKLEITPTKKVETPLKEDVERLAKVNAETLPKMNMKVPSQANLEGPSKANLEIAFQNMEDISEVKLDVSPKVNNEVLTDVNSTRHPESNGEELPTVDVDASSSVEPSPVVSEDSSPVLSTGSSSFVSVEISPVVSMDASPEASVDTSPELSTDSVSAVASEGNLETSPKNSGELNLETSMEARPRMNVEASPPKNPEVGKRNINLTTKKQLPSHIPCYRWPSSPALGWRPPSPMKAVQNQKIRPPSPLPVSSRLSAKTSLLYKVTPVQNILYVPNALSMITKKKEIVQKCMINTEFGNRSMPSSESAMNVSVEMHHAAFEQQGNKESGGVKETKQSVAKKSQGLAERADEVPAEFSPRKDEQQAKDLAMRHFEPPEEQKGQLQKGNNTMMKSQDIAETRKKEQEKIMLQNLQERLERKKRVEEIMKRTRKTDVNASKASEISGNCLSEEDEADDEGETESDEDSLEMFPPGMKTLTKHKKYHKNAKRRPQKLVFLQAGSGKVDMEKKIHFNGNTKAAKQNDPKDSTTQARGIKMPTKKPPTRTVRTRKTREANPTIRSALSVTTNQEWVCDKIIDFSHMTESPVTKTTAGSSKHNSKDSMTAHQAPQAPLDSKKRGKSVSAPLTKVLSHLNLAGGTTDLENSFSYGYSRMAFGGEEEDSDI
ncbi:MAP7 domain-containing protein 3 isoform X2 [Peromyscus californicus insignis]|uniref:MAP7 domain-containing protein 3 isoform X2 n=1 Tax=Peromyscus californicus insignis TaxID=564181 RepID=UPI0022A6CDCF|nr:MAP7 domain-containing protein 3 isoform X2 [Peromyscus californicus insignis]